MSEEGWLRLDGRMLGIAIVRMLLSVLPIAAALTILGADLDRGVRTALIGALLFGLSGAAGEAFRWATSRYRVTTDRVELRSGLLRRQARWVPRERIRTVDLKAGVLQRLLGLCVVRIGTGLQSGQGSGLKLDAVRTAEAERLQSELMSHQRQPAGPAPSGDARAPGDADTGPGRSGEEAGTPVAPTEPAVDRELAAFRLSRLPYSLLSWWTLALPAVALGGAFQALSAVGIRPEERQLLDFVTTVFEPAPPLAAISLGVLAAVALGALGAAGYSFEAWWRYRLTHRRRAGLVSVRHGLLTRRSKDIEERRMRGIELVETIPLRTARGAELRAIVTGLTATESPWGARAEALGPAMSRAEAAGIAGELLGERSGVAGPEPLRSHPPAALRRRRIRAIASAVTVAVAIGAGAQAGGVVGTGVAPLLLASAIVAAPLLGLGQWAARDAYHGLGNRLAGDHLVVRQGLLRRRTAVLERDGIVAWRLRATAFQRRAGLVTPSAATAAGRGAYAAPDMGSEEAVRLAREATPGLLDPFIAK